MSTVKSTSELIYRLDQAVNGQVTDRSGNENNGKLVNSPQKVSDPKLGACLRFDPAQNQYVAIEGMVYSGYYEAITVEAWIKTNSTGKAIIASFDRNVYWRLTITDDRVAGQLGWFFMTDEGQLDVYGSMIVNDGEWHHIVAIYDNGIPSIYVDGVSDKNLSTEVNDVELQVSQLGTRIGNEGGVDRFGYVGVGSEANSDVINTGPDHYFEGEIYVLRLYHEVLSEEEILENMANDESAMASFRGNYPIDFKFIAEKEENVLYIYDEPSGHTLSLDISNTSPQTITLNRLSTASEASYHFALVFKAGVLSSASKLNLNLAEFADWHMSLVENLDAGTVSVYFSSKKGIDVPASGTIQLNLHNISADSAGGARGTQVLLKHQLLFLDGTELQLGFREQYLSIVNHSGKKDIPLHVGFVGQNRVLNINSATNALKLRITNVLTVDPGSENNNITLYGATGVNPGAPTKFIISFDIDDTEEWALCSDDENGSIEIKSFDSGTAWLVTNEGVEGISPEWVLELPNDLVLSPGDHIDIDINGIESNKPNGHTNLYLNYENIPGYWDGQFIAIIEKAPLIHFDDKVGIGTMSPLTNLSVIGIVRGAKDENESDYTEIGHDDSNGYINTAGAGRLDFRHDGDNKMSLTADGNLGIGVSAPSEKLEVAGNIKADFFYDRNDPTYFCNPAGLSSMNIISVDSIWKKGNSSLRIELDDQSKINRLILDTGTGNALLAYNDYDDGPCISAKNSGDGYDYYAAGTKHYNQASSIRRKKEVKTIENALSMVQQLRGVRFKWKESNNADVGFIAEEVGKIIPEAVEFEEDGFAKGMSYDHVIPLLVEAVKTQQKMIDELMKTVAKLDVEVKKLITKGGA